MSRRERGVLWVGLALILVGLFFQSYNARQNTVQSQRAQCLAFERDVLVPLANALRADAVDNRSARAARAQIEALAEFDRHLDPRATARLNPTGRRTVDRLAQRGQAFSCEKAYPSAAPVQLFN